MKTNQQLREMSPSDRFSVLAAHGLRILQSNLVMVSDDDIERGSADCGYRIERDAVNENEDNFSFRRCCWFPA
jgi:hypothetical protein